MKYSLRQALWFFSVLIEKSCERSHSFSSEKEKFHLVHTNYSMNAGDWCFVCYIVITFTAALAANTMMIIYLIQHSRLEPTNCVIVKITKGDCSPSWRNCPYDVMFRGQVCGMRKDIHYIIGEEDFLRHRWHVGSHRTCFKDSTSCSLFIDNKPPLSFFFAWVFYNFLALLIIIPIYWALRDLYFRRNDPL